MAVAASGAVIWLALSYHSESLEIEAANVVLKGKAATPAEVDAAIRKVRRARALQPDAGPMLVEWQLLYNRGREREALAVVDAVARNEPENAHPWFVLGERARDPARAREAQRRFRALEPPQPGDR
jgi:predicted Zn-dependent protease